MKEVAKRKPGTSIIEITCLCVYVCIMQLCKFWHGAAQVTDSGWLARFLVFVMVLLLKGIIKGIAWQSKKRTRHVCSCVAQLEDFFFVFSVNIGKVFLGTEKKHLHNCIMYLFSLGYV